MILQGDCRDVLPTLASESVQTCVTSPSGRFEFAKSERYFYDADAIAEPVTSDPRTIQRARILGRGGQDYSLASAASTKQPQQDNSGGFPVRDMENPARNARSVWSIATKPFPEAHFAVFPPELARRCILAGSRPGDAVLDPFSGAGTTGLVAQEHNRQYVGIELNPEYIRISERRLGQGVLPLAAG